jgi:competence protein ComEA
MNSSRSKLIWYAAIALVAVVLGMRFLGGGSESGAASVALDGAPRATHVAATRTHERAWVHVAGAVRRPGLVRVRADARVGQAVDAAGGLTRRADLTAINLAATIKDGQQVIVPVRGKSAAAAAGTAPAPTASAPPAPTAGAPPATAASPTPAAKISLASATVEQLDTLDGIGPALAQRIVAWRDAHGGFRSVDQLGEVEGIGEKRLQALKTAVVP